MGLKHEMYITLFQDFSITYQDETIHLNDYLSKHTSNLLEVLILHHGKSVSKEKLIDILWDNNDNPDSALKFHICRLRKILKNIPLFSTLDLIKTDKNGYCFHPNMLWDSDCHQFEELHHTLAMKQQYQACDYQNMRELFLLYKGKLYYSGSIVWFLQKEEQYRCSFLRYIAPVCEYCLKDSRYDDVIALTSKAMSLEASNEDIYYYQILAYVKEGNLAQANEYYQKATNLLVYVYELELSKRMRDLHKEIIDCNEQKIEPEQIMMYYQQRTFENGAFYCTTTIFDSIFEQRLRDAKRMHTQYYLYVFEIDTKDSSCTIEHMQKLKTTMIKTLRSGDVFTKVNRSQYIALLVCPTKEIAFDIAQRVCNAFRTKVKKNEVRIHYHLQQMKTKNV